MRGWLSGVVFAVLALVVMTAVAPASKAQERENVMLILDASGSMWGRVGEQPKIEVARSVMGSLLEDLTTKANLGLMAYGHRRAGDCGDIEALAAVGTPAASLRKMIGALNPKGKTPITESVRIAAEMLRSSEQKATVVLVSDGLETCKADPCALARTLEESGVDFTVHVVGFDLGNEDTRTLRCMADNTGGRYFDASNAGELEDALGTVVAEVEQAAAEPPVEVAPPAPEPATTGTLTVLPRLVAGGPADQGIVVSVMENRNGRNVRLKGGRGDTRLKLAPKSYLVSARYGNAEASSPVEIVAGQESRVDLLLNAGLLSVAVRATEGGDPIAARVEIFPAASGGKRITVGPSSRKYRLVAGRYLVKASFGGAVATGEVDVKPGERAELALVASAGILVPRSLATEGGKPERGYYAIYEAKAGLDGKRKRLKVGPYKEFKLPAGRYYVEAKIGKAITGKEVEIRGGERTEVTFVIGVGVVNLAAVPAPGAKPLRAMFRIYNPEKDLRGKRKQVHAGPYKNAKLRAGKYLVTAKVGQAVGEMEIEVKAGQAVDAVVNVNGGRLVVTAVGADGKPYGKRIRVYFEAGEADLQGKRKRLANSRRNPAEAFLPAGNYAVVVWDTRGREKLGDAMATVSAGKVSEITVQVP